MHFIIPVLSENEIKLNY